MSPAEIRILLVEDDPDDVLLVRELLADARGVEFAVTEAGTLAEAKKLIAEAEFDVALLDLSLPDSERLQTLASARSMAPELPIVVLTGLDDQVTAMKALHSGAQDYLVKGHDTSSSLARAVRYAVARQRMERLLERSMEWERDSWERSQELHEYRHYLTMSKDTSSSARGDVGLPRVEILSGPEEDALEDLLSSYRDLVLTYVEAERARRGRPIGALHRFAERLAHLRSRARDVARLHLSLMGETPAESDPETHRQIVSEAHLVFADVLGALADIYLGETGGSQETD